MTCSIVREDEKPTSDAGDCIEEAPFALCSFQAVDNDGLEAVMADRSTVETLAQALAQFETVGMPARNLALRTRRENTRNPVTCSPTSSAGESVAWKRCGRMSLRATWLS